MRLAILLVLSTFLSSEAYAEDVGKFTFLGVNQCATFEGGLFDPSAMAHMVTTVEAIYSDCDLNLEYEIDKLASAHQLQIENLQIEYGVLDQKHEMLKKSSDIQIKSLQEALKKASSNNKWWWFAGGIATGVATTYGAYKAFNE